MRKNNYERKINEEKENFKKKYEEKIKDLTEKNENDRIERGRKQSRK